MPAARGYCSRASTDSSESSTSEAYRTLTTLQGEQVTLLFKHQGWQEQSEFMHHCSTKWASFLMSLKAFVESGKGTPFPNDVHISVNWD